MKSIFKNAKIVGSNVPQPDYRKQPEGAVRGDPRWIMSRGELKDFALCPHKWIKNAMAHDESESTKWGNMLDCAVLTPQSFETDFIIRPDVYPCDPTSKDPRSEKPWNNNATFCKDWNEEHADRNIISRDEVNSLEAALLELHGNPTIKELLECSQRQVMVQGEYHAGNGLVIPVRGLLDLLPDSKHKTFGTSIADLKSSKSVIPSLWARDVFKYGYDMQAALYSDLIHSATGEERETFYHVAQENEPPFEVMNPLAILSSEFIGMGRWKYQGALEYYSQCLYLKLWPSYSPVRDVYYGTQIIKPEAWMVGQMREIVRQSDCGSIVTPAYDTTTDNAN